MCLENVFQSDEDNNTTVLLVTAARYAIQK